MRSALTALVTVIGALLLAQVGQTHGKPVMAFSHYKPSVWDQYHWTNRALHNRCRPTLSISEFTRYPLADASAWWRDERIGWAKRKHHRAQDKSSLCEPYIAHESLWLCIHKNEGDWYTGYNPAGPYYGGLQMTWGWGILTGDPRNYSATEQMHAAEVGYEQSGYSQSWLFGQWPNTAPPCV